MKRLVAVLLCAALLFGCLPGAAALETDTEEGIFIIEADSAAGDTRHTIHNALEELSYTEGYRVIVRLRGSFDGQLCIPDFASSESDDAQYMDVMVEGVGDNPILTGGIQKERGVCEVENLTLVGAGKDEERWGEDEPYNTGLYGGGSFKVRNCTLQEFYCGMEWRGERLVVEDSTFLECGTGILVNSDDQIRESALTGNTFRENELAVHLQESSRMGAAWLINRNRFIDNAMEVQNDTDSRFFFASVGISCVGFVFVFLNKVKGAGKGYLVDISFYLVLGHTDTVIGYCQGLCFFVCSYGDLEFSVYAFCFAYS